MSDGDGVLGSFCDAEETLRGTWSVRAVERGWPSGPPGIGPDYRIGVTDRRVLWYDGEDLDSVALAAVEDWERDVHRHRSAPRIVRIGSGLMLTGLLATLAVAVLASVPLTVALAPVIGGSAAFAATLAYGRFAGATGTERVDHRLRIDEGGEPVTVRGDEAILDEIEAALRAARDGE